MSRRRWPWWRRRYEVCTMLNGRQIGRPMLFWTRRGALDEQPRPYGGTFAYDRHTHRVIRR